MSQESVINEWCRLAVRPSVMRRGMIYALAVGTILIVINHGDTILAGSMSRGVWLKMLLTVMVPYVVSTLSSVGAMRTQAQRAPS